MDNVRYERIEIGIIQSYAQKFPKIIGVFQTDKQNSNTTTFPYYARVPKDGEYLTKLPINLQGIIENGIKWKSWLILPIHGKHANTSVTIRFHHLFDISLQTIYLPSILRCK